MPKCAKYRYADDKLKIFDRQLRTYRTRCYNRKRNRYIRDLKIRRRRL